MAKVHRKKGIGINVYEAALARYRQLYEQFDTVVVSFSGGKDSTAALQVCIEVAREYDRLPVIAHFWDEEAIHPETIEYVHRVAAMPEVELLWYCLEVKHRNACSRRSPWWHCWDSECPELWVRDMPAQAITELEGFERGAAMPEAAFLPFMDVSRYGQVAQVRGLRASESLRRYRAVAQRTTDNWIGQGQVWQGKNGRVRTNQTPVSPIYDWTDSDVWEAPKRLGWDYNRAYDVMRKAGISRHDQRVCPPYGEEPLRGLYQYAECWPHLWGKMIHRVPGATTAARYSRTELYGFGDVELPPGKSWREWFFDLLEMQPKSERGEMQQALSRALKDHARKTQRDVPEVEPDLVTGISWKQLCMIAVRGDLKGRRIGQLNTAASAARAKLGISLEEALELESGSGIDA